MSVHYFLVKHVRECFVRLFLLTLLQVIRMANNPPRREGKETYEEKDTMTPDMKIMYRAFTSQF